MLEIGAGAGRFTRILATFDAAIVVATISSVQLDLNKRFAAEYGFDHAVVAWQEADICDLSAWTSDLFDAVVAYGGPFSYVLDPHHRLSITTGSTGSANSKSKTLE